MSNNNELINIKFKCLHNRCREKQSEYEGTIRKYQLGLVAIWFHSFHEGHRFEYWEDGKLILS